MADRDRRVALQQQHRHGLADDLAPADDDRVAPRDRDAGSIEDLDDAGGRARLQVRAPLHQLADVHRVEPVDVLVRIDRVEHALRGPLPDRGGQRRLDENAVVAIARVEAGDEREQIVEGRRRGQALQVHPEPGIVPRLRLVADVHLGSRIVADEDDPQAGWTPRASPLAAVHRTAWASRPRGPANRR